MSSIPTTNLPVRLFKRSILKQQKYAAIVASLGPTRGLRCLDVGSDNGVISYLLRQRGGDWASADLDPMSVASITEMVGTEVYQIGAGALPFEDESFDRILVVDYLEHVTDDVGFVRELYRILKPDGVLVINVPYGHHHAIRWIRHRLGQTDEQHGHVRPGYTLEDLRQLLDSDFQIVDQQRYSRFFSEATDAVIVFVVSRLKGKRGAATPKGLVVSGQDVRSHARLFKLYSLIYPVVWAISKLDRLLFFNKGYMLIVRADTVKTRVRSSIQPA